ncbi:Hint domain-containing protein, partial [Patulibacter sp. NPDC049589]|uniref:Hint domain-containing protein n=1 Tax=Patulibacter sp. NPDC049589 TaxID=3154731 RepID=UPI00343D1074
LRGPGTTRPTTSDHEPLSITKPSYTTKRDLTLDTGGERIQTTATHRFWDATQQRWISAGELPANDSVLSAILGPVTVDGPVPFSRESGIGYDLTVAGTHTYLVGPSAVLVHNCPLEGAPGRDARGRFTGAGGYGAEAEARGLARFEALTGITVVRNQVRATVSGAEGGRFYDGLAQNADGTYIGIEVKSGTASLSASQRAFDSAVNSGSVARAMLNGKPIRITSTELIEVR